MSSSEHDNTSESSNLDSPSLHKEGQYSPYSHGSPSQLVPQLAMGITELSCKDAVRDNKPYLRIVEQPMDYFRFRYKSEMMGTHGCLLGRKSGSGKAKSHPTVELCNYNGSAIIRCTLARNNSPLEHPHKLTEEDQDRDVTSVLPLHGSYKVAFNGMGIIHTAKKDIPKLLFKKYSQEMDRSDFNDNKLRVRCENEAKNINLNIVRLKFTAHDVNTGELICPPAFSEPIHNMKSAATNDLKICQMSRYYGRPSGRDVVFILVEKVNKKNILVRFFETDENGDRIWESDADFLDTDVHHQYAIVFRTPPYRDPKITSDVKVYFQLVRPSDGRTSPPKEFTYKADIFSRELKKRKAGSSFSSWGSSGGSIKSNNDLPLTLDFVNQDLCENAMEIEHIPTLPVSSYVPPTPPSNSDVMGEALLYNVSSPPEAPCYVSPMLSQPNVPPPPVIHLDSTEMNRLLEQNPHIPSEERRRFLDSDLSEYFRSFDENLSSESNMMSFVKNSLLVADSDRSQNQDNATELLETKPVKEEPTAKNTNDSIRNKSEYSAVYSAEDGMAVKTLVKELCEIIRNKGTGKRQIVQDKLKRLFDMRLSNGDTFLHMTLCSNQPSLQVIVKMIHDVDMSSLLNIQNYRLRSILHLAVIKDQPELIPFLIAKGCDPMLVDDEGNNVIHYAVISQTCLEPVLAAARTERLALDIDACNYEKQTALHLSAIYGSEKSARLLLEFGASCLARDNEGRTPLHLAASGDAVAVVALLVEKMAPSDVDAVDDLGFTALQLVCAGRLRPHSLEIAKLLLDKKADPVKCEESRSAAWRLARDKPPLLELLRAHADFVEDDVKSEPEDDYESADEGDDSSELADLPLYIDEIAAILDRSEGYRELAKRLHRDSLLKWFEASHSPTFTLLTHVKELNDDVTSKSLALLLEDIGEKEAATIIKKRIL